VHLAPELFKRLDQLISNYLSTAQPRGGHNALSKRPTQTQRLKSGMCFDVVAQRKPTINVITHPSWAQ
jgi:hypothetical protein